MGNDLSILCITRAEQCVLPLLHKLKVDALDLSAEFVLVADGEEAHYTLFHDGFDMLSKGSNIPIVHSKGYIESVLDEAIGFTSGNYILRIDDDESISHHLLKWLASGQYRTCDNWTFPRANLWQDEEQYIVNAPLWPDYQTRLSIRSKSGGRLAIHDPSPYGSGETASCPILHHKFLVRSFKDRKRILNQYERMQEGAGSGFVPFSLPETLDRLMLARVASCSSELIEAFK